MITSLELNNFQSHEHSKLIFHNGVNVIVGNSDAGKSTIIRALRWLIWNRPSGDSVRSHWGGKTSVEVSVDGNDITRHKDKVDTYQIQKDGKKLEFKAIGTSVPEEVSRLVNVNEINLQLQLDRPFLLSDSAGEVASHFNRVARLDKIDTGITNVNSAIRNLEQTIRYKEGEEQRLEQELKEYDYLAQMEAEVEVLEQMETRLRVMKGSLDDLQLKLYDYSQNEIRIDSYLGLLSFEQKVNTILELRTKKDVEEVLLNKLERLTERLFLIQDDIEDAQRLIEDENTVNTLLGLYNSKNTAVAGLNALSKLLLRYGNTKGLIEAEQAELARLEAKFKKEMGDVCLLCGQKIK